MPIQVIMPKLGESVDEGTITKWLKVSGEKVEEYEPLLEVNTDKVDTEVPSPASGVVLEILAPEGVTVRAGAILALIEAVGETPATEAGQTGRGAEPPVLRRRGGALVAHPRSRWMGHLGHDRRRRSRRRRTADCRPGRPQRR